ncbi:hypothetical protein Q9R08_20225 [Microbacterium sp. QXD-8]|uniref:Aldehyde dehydrogenase domain-containing protein n=1 Tax=Microbacterium psychrotolerans TaxID=3068321 RepID=A0ABU0Z6U9_9MICO|nr:hypothetical protein [Microbacterium sp. QXD-8]MDQ7880326.1 hypothetical protein [Microbacterium sp. QXD-8]
MAYVFCTPSTLASTSTSTVVRRLNPAVARHLAEQAVELGENALVSSGDEFRSGSPSNEALLMPPTR